MSACTAELRGRAYPGRVCAIVHTRSDGIRFVYALTGRSDASRARSLQLHADTAEVVDTRPLGEHDMLRHYVAAVHRGPWLITENGDHVEPLAEALSAAGGVDRAAIEAAWAVHTFEPDPPIYTPRIWIAAHQSPPSDEHDLWAGSVTRAENGSPTHRVWRIDPLAPGAAAMLTTYAGPLDEPQPAGEIITGEFDSNDNQPLEQIWAALDPTLRIAAIELDPNRPVESARYVISDQF